jgi:hypothetical protein
MINFDIVIQTELRCNFDAVACLQFRHIFVKEHEIIYTFMLYFTT